MYGKFLEIPKMFKLGMLREPRHSRSRPETRYETEKTWSRV